MRNVAQFFFLAISQLYQKNKEHLVLLQGCLTCRRYVGTSNIWMTTFSISFISYILRRHPSTPAKPKGCDDSPLSHLPLNPSAVSSPAAPQLAADQEFYETQHLQHIQILQRFLERPRYRPIRPATSSSCLEVCHSPIIIPLI